jgi:hypothetical protein
MIEYFIKSYHSIYEDSYNDGELDFANGYELSYFIKADSPANAIQQYIENKLYYKFNSKCFCEDNEQSNVCHYNVLVDEENCEASESEYELWKQGKMQLYTDNIRIAVYTMTPVVL